MSESRRSSATCIRHTVKYRIGDRPSAESLPFADGEFDVVLSSFGVMISPQPRQAVAELLRVCRPGGRIGLTNWTPDSFVGQILHLVSSYVPPPIGVPSPLEWGTKACVGNLFGTEVNSIGIQRREFVFRYGTPQYWLETFRTFYGLTHQSLGVLDGLERDGLQRDLLALAGAHLHPGAHADTERLSRGAGRQGVLRLDVQYRGDPALYQCPCGPSINNCASSPLLGPEEVSFVDA